MARKEEVAGSLGSTFTGTSVISVQQMSQGILQTGNRMLVGGPEECTDSEAGKWQNNVEAIQVREFLWSGPQQHQEVKTSFFMLPPYPTTVTSHILTCRLYLLPLLLHCLALESWLPSPPLYWDVHSSAFTNGPSFLKSVECQSLTPLRLLRAECCPPKWYVKS